MVATGLAVLHK